MKFKPGHTPTNTLADGHISIRKHGQFIRVDGRWVPLHIHNWTQVHGPIPKGHVLKSIDGNLSNCNPDNWQPISRADLLARNRNYEKARISMKEAWAKRKQQRHDKSPTRIQKAK